MSSASVTQTLSRSTLPVISIITVVKNIISVGRKSHFVQLVESVQSAQRRSGQSYEHIVIDGNSDDGTAELVERYAREGYFAQWTSEIDTGVYDAMNKGAKLARGAYYMFINSDDYVLPDGLEAMRAVIEKSGCDYCVADARLENENGRIGGVWRASVERTLLCYVSCHQAVAVSARGFAKVQMFNTSYRIAADVDMMMALYTGGYSYRIVHSPVVVFRAGGVSMNSRVGHDECVDICMRAYGNALNLSDDEVRLLIHTDPCAWLFTPNRARIAEIVKKLRTAKDTARAANVCAAMLTAVFDDESGRNTHVLSAAAMLDTPFSQSVLLPTKRRYAFLLAAAAKKMRLYWLIKPLRDIIVKLHGG